VTSIEDVLAAARPVERVVRVCLRGDLLAEWDRLEAQLQAARASGVQGSLAAPAPSVGIARHMEDLAEQIADAGQEFRVRGLNSKGMSDLIAAHPPVHGEKSAWNPDTFVPALLAACVVDPQMTVEQATALLAVLNRDQTNVLFGAAWDASTGAVDVPFSDAVSEILRGTGEK
jgi:hypothetical protein